MLEEIISKLKNGEQLKVKTSKGDFGVVIGTDGVKLQIYYEKTGETELVDPEFIKLTWK